MTGDFEATFFCTCHLASPWLTPEAAPSISIVAITRTIIVTTPGAWTFFVEILVQIPEGTMIGTVLTPAVETVFMSAFVGAVELAVNSPVGCLILVFMRESRRHSGGQYDHRGCGKNFGEGHFKSPMPSPPPRKQTELFPDCTLTGPM